MAREAWTDERLDDLSERVAGIDRRMEAGFAKMREEFRAMRSEMREEFKAVRGEMGVGFNAVRGEMGQEIKAVRGEMGVGFNAVRAEMLSLHRTTMTVVIGGFVTMLVGFGGTIATILLTQA